MLASGVCPLPLSSVEAGAGDCSVLGQCTGTGTCVHAWACYVHDDDIIEVVDVWVCLSFVSLANVVWCEHRREYQLLE